MLIKRGIFLIDKFSIWLLFLNSGYEYIYQNYNLKHIIKFRVILITYQCIS